MSTSIIFDINVVSKKSKIIAADLFCGAGGTSSGLIRACRKMGIDVDLLAVNHWPTAIATHSANHPNAKHVCARIDQIRPEDTIPGGRLHLLVASPECTHHSKARGGKPMNDQSRATAWDILNWVNRLYVDNILIENVTEFMEWGPLGANGRPLKSKRGETFRAFIAALERVGYNVDYKVLNAANYGDATTRERLFIIARRKGQGKSSKIIWPEATHAAAQKVSELFGEKKPWRSAREIIDWSLEGQSIFARKKPLADATLKRIEAGLRKFGGKSAEPFIVVLRQHMDAQSLDEPLPTITAGGQHIAVCEPFVLGQQSGSVARSVEDPLPTIATDGAIAVVEPFIVPQFGESQPRSVEEPIGTITTTSRGIGLCEPYLIVNRTNNTAKALAEPIPTLCTGNHVALVEPFLTPFYGTSGPASVDEPLGTVTTRDRFGLVMPQIEIDGQRYYVDIRFRTVQPHELAAAMGFPEGYKFEGNKSDIVKQIGNAVPGHLSEALCSSLISKAA